MQDQIDVEIVKTYLQQSRLAIWGVCPLAWFLAVSYYHVAPTSKLLLWVILATAFYGYTLYAIQQFKSSMPIYKISFIGKRQHFLHMLSGMLWGSSYFLLLDARHPQITDFRLIVTVGVVLAFSSTTMSVTMRGLMGFVGMVSVFAAAFFFSNLAFYGWWILGLLGLSAACLVYGWQAHQYVLGQIENRLLNASYIEELRALNSKVEANNQDFIKRNVELQNMQKRLEMLASHDALTGLYNRRYVLERIEEKLPEMRRHQLNFCLMIMDIDHFKNVNDEFGHAAGDEVLRGTADILTRELRQGDIVARYGGEEFLMLLPMTELSSAESLVERLRGTIQNQNYMFEDTQVSVTASFGLTQYSPNDTADKMIDRADKALYQAKLAGRNCVKVIVKPEKI